MARTTDPDEMDMPCPCTHCGDWFDLQDGRGSKSWYPNTVICERCAAEEREEMDSLTEDDDEEE